MIDRPQVPGHEHFVSAVEFDGETLSLRLVSNWHPGAQAAAFALQAHGIKKATEALAFLTSFKEQDTYVYVSWMGDELVISSEVGGEILIEARGFTGGVEHLNTDELTRELTWVYSLYAAASDSSRASSTKLSRLQHLLIEQVRRIEVKAASHESQSAAGVLYAQQLSFIERMLREME
jgi:hypothetical protein